MVVPGLAFAQDRAVDVEAPAQVSLGDPIAVILSATVRASDDVAVPEQPLEPFEILEKQVRVEMDPGGDSKTFTFELELLSFEVGTHQLGPIAVRVTSSDGSLIELESPTRSIEVQSLLANEPDPELRPPTDPVVVEQDDYRLWIALGVLIALAVGALLAWLFMRWWQKRERPEIPGPPPPPPWETALRELRALEARRAEAIAEGGTEQWVDAVSDSVRKYLGDRFGFPGLESTTDEIARELSAVPSLSIVPGEAVAFLGQCDLVKFAKASLADEASAELIDEALSMVEKTRPAVPTQEGGKAA